MEFSKELDEIKKMISQGNLEEGYEHLLKLLNAFADYPELADIARINQAELYQLKAQDLKGAIDPDDARVVTNQLADNALKIVRQLETGKVYFEPEIKPHSSKAWRYYLTGGIATLLLAAAVFYFLNNRTDECPDFGDDFETRVMILPILDAQTENPADDIMDELTKWIEQTPSLEHKASVAVHRRYDIQNEYPNSTQAIEIAKKCEAQMLVWGKKRTLPNNNYILDVRYRLLKAGSVIAAGDTMINQLLRVTEEASLTSDAKAIGRLLYMVLSNYKRAPIAANFMKTMEQSVAPSGMVGDSMARPPIDTSFNLALAEQYIVRREPEKAEALYDNILEQHPDNVTARTKRGALLFQKGEYQASARDLAAVPIESAAAPRALREVQFEALQKSHQPAKADNLLETARREGSFDSASVVEKKKQVQDTAKVVEKSRVKWELAPKTQTNRLNAASDNLKLGNATKAEKIATEVLDRYPRSVEAVKIKAQAQLENGDTAKAVQTVKKAINEGVKIDAKTVLPGLRKIIQPKSAGGGR